MKRLFCWIVLWVAGFWGCSSRCPAPCVAAETPPASARVVALYDTMPDDPTGVHETAFVKEGETTLINITRPSLELFLPPLNHTSGAALLLLLGGANCMLNYTTEGVMVARWFQQRGIAAIVLKYHLTPLCEMNGEGVTSESAAFSAMFDVMQRVGNQFKQQTDRDPTSSELMQAMPNAAAAYGDALQALCWLREHADQWQLDRDRIGILGFSAGAVLAMQVALHHTAASRPNLVGVLYGGWPDSPSVPSDAAPLFVGAPAHDVFAMEESWRIYQAWQQAQRPAELHYFSSAPHGFGGKALGISSDGWAEMFLRFMQDVGFLPKPVPLE